MTFGKIGALVRMKERIACMALSALLPDVEVPMPDHTHCNCNAWYNPLQHQGGPSYEGPPVFHSQSESRLYRSKYPLKIELTRLKSKL